MSAFIVSKLHIDFLITAAVGWKALEIEEADKTGAMLWRENYKSVNYRYQERDRCPKYTLTPFDATSPLCKNLPINVLSCIACLEYQSCEHPGWARSEAKRFLSELRDVAIRQLPGYADAPWGIG